MTNQKKTDYICISKESEGPAPDTLDETLPTFLTHLSIHNWPPKDFMVEKGKTDTENLRNSAWICSLSKIHDSLLMWSYYGNHKGVCVGLDMEKANKYLSRIQCGIFVGAMEMEVQYRDVIDKPDYFRDAKDFFRYQLSTKAKAWELKVDFAIVTSKNIDVLFPHAEKGLLYRSDTTK